MSSPLSLILVLGCLSLCLSACAGLSRGSPGVSEPAPEWELEGWELVWHDEFDGETLDPDSWTLDQGASGWGNNEWQHYTDRLENVRIENGVLIIEAHREDYHASDYTSARLKTRG